LYTFYPSCKVVVEPIRDLDRDEVVPLLVTLVDGTEIPFIVKPPFRKDDGGRAGWTDQQVNVFKDPESYDTVLSSLYDSLKRERELSEEVERLRQEENSIDHAYATLLANGQAKKTPFKSEALYRPKNADMEMVVELFSGPSKAAAVITLTNTYYGRTWTFDDAYLTRDLTSLTTRPFALRMNRATIVPGQTGTIAVVVDRSAFETKDGALGDLALQIFRGDGLRQVAVALEHSLLRK
jgi:hypothetical protein